MKLERTGSRRQWPEYSIWRLMISRILNSKDTRFKYYGGRGIKIDSRWQTFDAFIEDMGLRPSKEYSLDRIDNNGDYCKANCRWATKIDQANNKRNNIRIKLDGLDMTATQWGRFVGIKPAIIFHRLDRGWTHEEAVKTPLGVRRSKGKPSRS